MAFRIYMQSDSMDCGPACLRMVARHYGRHLPLTALRERSGIGKAGVSLLGLSEAAESIGLRTHAVKTSLQVLKKDFRLPAILHWRQYHFVVLYKIKGEKFFIADPARGLVNYGEKEFLSNWISDRVGDEDAGIGLLLEPSPAFYQGEGETESGYARTLVRYLYPYRKFLVQLFAGLAVTSLLQLILPFLTQSIVDEGIHAGDLQFISIILLAQAGVFAGRMVVELIRSWILLYMSSRISISILSDFLAKLMKLPLSFFDSRNTGDILQRMNDHGRIESFLTGSSLQTVFSLFNLFIFSIVLYSFSTMIFAVFFLANLLYAGWVMVFLRKRRELDHKRFEISAREQNATIQLVQGMQEIRINGVEKSMRWSWESIQARLFRLNIKGLALNQWQQSGAFFINEGKNIMISFLAASAVVSGELSLGTMLAVQYVIGQLNSPVEQMIGFVQAWQNARMSLDRLHEVGSLPDEEPEGQNLMQALPGAYAARLAGGSLLKPGVETRPSPVLAAIENLEAAGARNTVYGISFRQVSFSYPGAGNEPVLKDVDIFIPCGKKTAIVGSSGSGKTTLLKLLLRLVEPQRGEIRLDQTPLSQISHKVWRRHCGVVMQDSFVFSDTIARNIAIGEEDVDMERLYHAVEIACLQEFIDALPLGFNTKIGAEGSGISMGQKQRLLIARAVYRDPSFLFLDEATNSLDAVNERFIVQNLDKVCRGRTVVIVAHRLSTVRDADQIIVLNRGRVTECGDHQQLIGQKGEYFTLVKNQLELQS